MITPQNLIEKITAAADYEDCIVIVESKTQANLRWANSTLTTNGVIATQRVTVIAFVAIDGGIASGLSRSPVLCLIALTQGRVSSYVMSDIGATELGRWHV